MKTKVYAILAMILCCSVQLSAQTTKVPDKELIGVWVMESMQFEGEKKIECGTKSNYSQVKVYRANGEYACAELSRDKNGYVHVLPHEYGTYTFKNGVYTEMGREPGYQKLLDANTFEGRWHNRHDIWKKKQLPERLTQYIVDCCKTKNPPKDIQQLMQQTFFGDSKNNSHAAKTK